MNSQNLYLGLAITLVAGLGLAGLTSLVVTRMQSPATYADCILAYVPRNSGPAVGQIVKACRDKFPLDFSAYAADPNAKSQ